MTHSSFTVSLSLFIYLTLQFSYPLSILSSHFSLPLLCLLPLHIYTLTPFPPPPFLSLPYFSLINESLTFPIHLLHLSPFSISHFPLVVFILSGPHLSLFFSLSLVSLLIPLFPPMFLPLLSPLLLYQPSTSVAPFYFSYPSPFYQSRFSISLLNLCPLPLSLPLCISFSSPIRPFLPSPPSTPAPNSSSISFLSLPYLSTCPLCSISHHSSSLDSSRDPIRTASTNSVESDLGFTSRIYLDNVMLTLHNMTLMSQKPCQHNNKCDCSKTNSYK